MLLIYIIVDGMGHQGGNELKFTFTSSRIHIEWHNELDVTKLPSPSLLPKLTSRSSPLCDTNIYGSVVASHHLESRDSETLYVPGSLMVNE